MHPPSRLLLLFWQNSEKPLEGDANGSSMSSRKPPDVPVARKASAMLGEELVADKKRGGFISRRKKPSILRRDQTHEVGQPRNVKHQLHVNQDFNWDGGAAKVKIQKKLGEGAFGSVWLGRHEETGQSFALKQLPVNGDKAALAEIRKEIDILRKCRHANIVCYFGTLSHDDKNLYILMEACDCSLRDMIELNNEALSESMTVQVAKCTLGGLLYLHAQKVVHRDIKGGRSNMLRDEKTNKY